MIHREFFFPTPVYIYDVPNPVELNVDLEERIIGWSQKDKGIKKTNVNGWHSTTEMHKDPFAKPLIDELFKMMNEIFKVEQLNREPVLGNMWANINTEGAYNKMHIHSNTLFSGVYYVKAPSKSGILNILDPRPGAHLVLPARKKENLPPHLWQNVEFNPVAGRAIVFPAWLWHEVEPNRSQDARISVSFNFIQKGFE